MGTPAFAAPEQLRGAALDVRSDLYATGATLYYLLTGRAPIEETDLVRLVARIGQEAPPSPRVLKPSVPAGLALIVLRCLAKDPAKRFETYADLSTALAALSSLAPAPASIGPRLMAGLLDLFFISVVNSAVTPVLLQMFVAPVAGPLALSVSGGALLLVAAVVQALVCFAYFGLLEGIGSRSLGKRACGIRVAASDGGSAGARNVWSRSFVFRVCGVVATFAPLPAPQFSNARFSAALGGVDLFRLVLRGAAKGSTFTIYSVGPFPIGFLLIFVSARRRNGYAGLQRVD